MFDKINKRLNFVSLIFNIMFSLFYFILAILLCVNELTFNWQIVLLIVSVLLNQILLNFFIHLLKLLNIGKEDRDNKEEYLEFKKDEEQHQKYKNLKF